MASDQKLIIAGSVGRESEGTISHFFAKADLTGKVLGSFDLGSYEPALCAAEQACVASDGTLWMLGQDWKAEVEDSPYMMLRNYSLDGRFLQSYLDRGDIPVRALNLSARLRDSDGATGRFFLTCGEDSIGVYIDPAHTWVEFLISTGAIQVWRVKDLPSARITGLARLQQHAIYASFNSTSQRGLFRLDLS